MTTSLLVAKVYGKRHDNVLREIESLASSNLRPLFLFRRTSYRDDQDYYWATAGSEAIARHCRGVAKHYPLLADDGTRIKRDPVLSKGVREIRTPTSAGPAL